MYNPRFETITKTEVRHTRTVNGKVVADDYDSHIDRDVKYGAYSAKRLKGIEDSYAIDGRSEGGLVTHTREINFETMHPLNSYAGGQLDDPLIRHPSDGGSEASDREYPDARHSSRSSISSEQDTPRRKGSTGSQTKSSSVTMTMRSNSQSRMSPSPAFCDLSPLDA